VLPKIVKKEKKIQSLEGRGTSIFLAGIEISI
jgi:hypothetical protein